MDSQVSRTVEVQLGIMDNGSESSRSAARTSAANVTPRSAGRATVGARFFCPEPGCRAGSSETHAGWETKGEGGLKSHVDGHVWKQLPGMRPQMSMTDNGWVVC